jgi:hypothetical protein
MRQLEYIQVLYAFHFDFPPKKRAQNTSTVLTTFFGIPETSK